MGFFATSGESPRSTEYVYCSSCGVVRIGLVGTERTLCNKCLPIYTVSRDNNIVSIAPVAAADPSPPKGFYQNLLRNCLEIK